MQRIKTDINFKMCTRHHVFYSLDCLENLFLKALNIDLFFSNSIFLDN